MKVNQKLFKKLIAMKVSGKIDKKKLAAELGKLNKQELNHVVAVLLVGLETLVISQRREVDKMLETFYKHTKHK
jgi:hypothetical protein